MEEDNPKYLQRRVKSGHVSLTPDERGLLLTYDVEATVVGDTGVAMQTERKTHQRKMKIKMDKHTDVHAYALQLVESNDLIPNSKVRHVEDLLHQIKQNVLEDRFRADSVDKVKRDVKRKQKEEKLRQKRLEREKREEERAKEELANASMEELDEYLEWLYDEDIQQKVRGTGMVLHLAREAGNLEELSENEALMGALSRTLKEDSKRSIELALNIMNIFMFFSTFSQFHPCLHSYQVGNNSMRIIKWELERFAARLEEVALLEEVAAAQERGETPANDPRKPKKRGEPVNLKHERAKTKTLQKKQDKILCLCVLVLLNLAEDERVEKKMAKRQLVDDLVRVLTTRTSNNTELLVLTTTFMKKLSVTSENKDAFRELGVVEHLAKFVPCSNEKLMKVVLSTLFNLSFDKGIREQMIKASFLPKLVDLLQNKHFRGISLRLLYHLSIDDRVKSMFTYTEVIPYMMRMIIDFPSNHVGSELAALAINLSLNERNCAFMCQGNNFKHLVDRAIKRQDPLLFKIVRNLSRWTLSMQEDIGADDADEKPASRERSTKYKYKRLWEPHIQPLLRLITSAESPNVFVEAIGTLGNLTPSDLPKGTTFADLVLEHDLVELLHKHLLPGFSEDDVLLEVIVLVGQLCLDEPAAKMLANSPLVKLIYDLLHEKQDDSELVLQTLFCFFRLLRHHDTGYGILYETEMPRDVCEFLHHKNGVVRVMADNLLDLIVDHDEANERSMSANRRLARKAIGEGKRGGPEFDDDDDDDDATAAERDERDGKTPELQGTLSKLIRAKRFAIHNREWVDVMAQDLDDEEDEHDDESSSFMDQGQFDPHGLGSPLTADSFLSGE